MSRKNKNHITTKETTSSQNKPTREGFIEFIKEQLIKINKVSKWEDEGEKDKKH